MLSKFSFVKEAKYLGIIIDSNLDSDVARPLIQNQDHLFFQDQNHFFKTNTALFKDGQIIKPRPKKRFLTEKSGQLCRFCPVMTELCR